MFRIDGPTAAAALPAPLPVSGTPGYFEHAPPGSGAPPTIVTSDWCNTVQEELVGLLVYAGIAPDKADHTQVRQAISSMIGAAGVVGAGSIFGLTTANAVGNPTTRITISVGMCRDTSNTAAIVLGGPLTKRLDAAWAVGNNNGGRDTGALANGQTWHMFMILNPTTSVVDALFSQSPTAPTLPAGFTKFRRIGAVILDAAATTIREYSQDGDWFELKTRSVDFANQANGGGVSYFRQITVPDGITVEAEVYFQSSGGVSAPALSGLFNPAFGAPVAFGGAAQWAQVRRLATSDGSAGIYSYGTVMVRVRTDATRHVYTFSNDTADVIALGVVRWRDERGKLF